MNSQDGLLKVAYDTDPVSAALSERLKKQQLKLEAASED